MPIVFESGKQRFNVELKARYPDRDRALRICERLGAERVGVERQVDTYFATGGYRMKLRESSLGKHWLIGYRRPDDRDSRKSTYRLTPVPDPAEKLRILKTAMGVKVVVSKERLFFLLDNVRIHIDRVEGLGDYLEFEAVLESEAEEIEGHARIAELREEFGISDDDLVSLSYSDLVRRTVDQEALS
jgi:predicted adenylyl cyclase CyaB